MAKYLKSFRWETPSETAAQARGGDAGKGKCTAPVPMLSHFFVPQEDGHESTFRFFRHIIGYRSSLVRLNLEGGTGKGQEDQERPGICPLCEFLHRGPGETSVSESITLFHFQEELGDKSRKKFSGSKTTVKRIGGAKEKGGRVQL